ncbi:MAG: hypothetical protein Q7S00_04390 [bacterium]|nr:hypothetical protein [bacterium]
MGKNAYAVKLDEDLLDTLKEFCEEKGYKQGSFVTKALWEAMEKEELKEDIFDLVTLRSSEKIARHFQEYDRHRK